MIALLRGLTLLAFVGCPVWVAWSGASGWWLLGSAALINALSSATDPRSIVALKRRGWEHVLIIWATTLPVVLVIQAAIWLIAILLL